ncbi:MAG TPA: hypothetical protein VHZ52_16605 [Acidobacteriaceae bacterium]|jgi:hypothetical protein|nr:hypothetical protein [Acidobacteriaceae bacterium]
MKGKLLGLTVLLVAFAGSALAQTQFSGTLKCGDDKGGVEHTIEVGDHPGHQLMIGKSTCTYTTPIVIAGLKSITQTGASTTEINGPKGQEQVYAVVAMENGDKAYVHAQDTGVITEGGKVITYHGTFFFTGGTGKLKGLKGKGTYKGSGDPVGLTTSQIEGEYTLPGATNPGK